MVAWDARSLGEWRRELDGADAVINLAGRSVNGRQYVSWVHEQDFVQAVYWLIRNDSLEGAINIASPNPLPNARFMEAIRHARGIRFGLPATAWMLEIGASFLKTETELILKSRRVVPTRLLQSGFTFQFPTWAEAAEELCRRWRREEVRGEK